MFHHDGETDVANAGDRCYMRCSTEKKDKLVKTIKFACALAQMTYQTCLKVNVAPLDVLRVSPEELGKMSKSERKEAAGAL